jgi:hypothetical protein
MDKLDIFIKVITTQDRVKTIPRDPSAFDTGIVYKSGLIRTSEVMLLFECSDSPHKEEPKEVEKYKGPAKKSTDFKESRRSGVSLKEQQVLDLYFERHV